MLGEYYSLDDFNLKTSVWRNKVSQPCVLLTWPQIMDHWGRSLLSFVAFLSSLSPGSQTSCRYWGCKNPCVRFSRFILIILIILIIMIILTIMAFQLHTVICVHRDPKGMFTLMGATGLSAQKSGRHSHGRSPLHSKEHAYKLIDKLNTQHEARNAVLTTESYTSLGQVWTSSLAAIAPRQNSSATWKYDVLKMKTTW